MKNFYLTLVVAFCFSNSVFSQSNSIYDIVVNSTNHTTLEIAIDTCSLDGVLSGSGTFTLFAPTDSAFNLLPSGTIAALLSDLPQLTGILTHHVLGDTVMSNTLFSGQIAQTLLGSNLTVTIDSVSGSVHIDNAMVTVADIICDNGVIHVIDAVLLPPLGCTDSLALNYDPLALVDNGSCTFPITDCNGIVNGTSLADSCGVCQQAYIFNFLTQNFVQFIDDTTSLSLGTFEEVRMPNHPSNSLWNSSCSGCTDPLALNYDSSAIINDGSCNYQPVIDNLFISEYAEGSTGTANRYFEIYNPTSNTIDLANYAFARVTGNPNNIGVYETWNNFDSGAVILAGDVYIVAHPSADIQILLEADMNSTALSNGDDGMALVYGTEPLTPTHPDSGLYTVLDWIGDWNGDPGQGWDVAGVTAATRDHTLVRKCNVMMGDTSWSNAAGIDALSSQWVVFDEDTWSFLGSHSVSPTYSTFFDTICNGSSITVNGNMYDTTGIYSDTLVNSLGCDSVITTYLHVLTISASFLNIDYTICDGDSIYVANSIYFETGMYYDTLTNSVGCDSVIITDLTVQTPTYLVYNICPGDSVVVGANVYSSAGIYTDSLISSIGCDSLVITEVTVFTQYNSVFGGIEDNTVGAGGFYAGDQHLLFDCYVPSEIVSATVYSDGNSIYEFELRDNNGNTLADTIYVLADGANFVTLNFDMPAGTDYQLGVSPASGFEGLWRNDGGVNFPYDFGSLASITQSSASGFGDYYYFFYNLELRASSSPTEYSICQGDSITVGTSVYTTTGQYVDSMLSVSGCDSLVLTNLTVNPVVNYQNNQTVCLGEVYVFGSNVYDSTGVYIDSLQTSFGCDSIVYTNLLVDTITGGSSTNNTTICYGDFFIVGNNSYTSSGTYVDILTAANGCDSTVTTNLNVLSASYPVIFGGIPDSASAPGGYFAFDRRLVFDCYSPSTIASALIYSEDFGSVTFELRDDNGTIIESSLQSVVPGPQRVILNFDMPVGTDYELGVDNPNQVGLFRSNTNVNYPYNFGSLASLTGSTANNTGFYYFFYDIELVGQATANVLSICDGDSVVVGSNTYYDTGIYFDTLDASNFCDSVIYTDLTVNQPIPVNLTTNPSNGKLCIGDFAIITASGGFQSYSWDNGMNGQVISDNPVVDQLYTVIAIDANNCRSESSVMIYVDSCTTGINSDIFSSLSIYPNPSNGIVNIDLEINDLSALEISVFNVLGEEVYKFKANDFIGEYANSIDLSSKTKGVYLLKIRTSNSLINRKLVIE